jgi:hypothetical protein
MVVDFVHHRYYESFVFKELASTHFVFRGYLSERTFRGYEYVTTNQLLEFIFCLPNFTKSFSIRIGVNYTNVTPNLLAQVTT